MKRVLYLLIAMLLLVGLAACGPPEKETGAPGSESAGSLQTPSTPTSIVLATPTPRAAPSTPTPKPTNTPAPTPEPTNTPEKTADGATAQPEPTAVPTEEPKPMLETEMVLVPAGAFTQGSDDAQAESSPARSEELAAFEIDKFEVTNDDFAMFADATGYQTAVEQSGGKNWRDYADGKGNHPVVKVTWDDAVAFCEWAEKRLPTEAEWEKAARGEDGRTYPWGADFDAGLANVKDTAIRGTTAVGSFAGGASPYGAEDMAGNVWEWTADWYQAYPGGATANPYYGEQFRVTRGGAWFEEAAQVTTFVRNAADPTITANDDLGFRCVRDAE